MVFLRRVLRKTKSHILTTMVAWIKPAWNAPADELRRRFETMMFGRSMRGPKVDIKSLIAVRPPPIVDSGNKLVLLWSAKAGCTFAIKWLFDHMGLLEEAIACDPWVHRYRNGVLYASARHRAAVEDFTKHPSSYRVIKVVRDPFRRAVSSYIHAAVSSYEDARMSAFLGVTIDNTARFSFRQFISYLGSVDLRECDVHHRLQTHPLERCLVPAPAFVINLEHSMESLSKLEAYLGLPPTDLGRYRESRHHTRTASENFAQCCGDVAFDIHHKPSHERAIPAYRHFYDADLEEKVYALYAEDFLRYAFPTSLNV